MKGDSASASEADELCLIANARLPSQRAQSLQVVQVAGAFQRAGANTTLLHARRVPTPALPPGQDLFDYYGVRALSKPAVRALPCIDWIDRMPTRLQFVPARIQELSFARNAAKTIRREYPQALVLSREAESARSLVRAGHRRVFLEVHRVPGGATRRRWLRDAAAGARGVLAISGGVRDDLVDLGVDAESIQVEHDGFEARRFEGLPTKGEAREQLGLESTGIVAVYTGGLMDWKGVDLLVDAASALPEVQIVIAGGTDADVARLRERAQGRANLRIDGFKPPELVPIYLAAADMAVVPNRSQPAISSRYTSPLKVFEAFAAGLPMVASNLPSLRDILTHEVEALLVEPDDAAHLAAGIERLASDSDLRQRLALASKARAADTSWDARAERILAWMREREAAGR